ncbi:Extracellular ligand-binding receptor [Acidiphilium sp. PM]|nr:Extracellular ligand-binding receptor [Acidiphilium sp. PM]
MGIGLAAAVALAAPYGIAHAASGPIKIGVQAPITGTYADEGQGIEKAVKLLADQQNAKGAPAGPQDRGQGLRRRGQGLPGRHLRAPARE